jgi:large subunit ribosomal protein L19
MDLLKKLEQSNLKKSIASFKPGDTIRVNVKIKEGDKTRIQPFEGVVIGRKGSGSNETFSVRRLSYGEGVERIFFVHSPHIENIKVLRRGNVRRAKLYYLRSRLGKKAKVKGKYATEEKGTETAGAPETKKTA